MKMKQAILILMCYIIRIKSEAPDWAPVGTPLITHFPCEQTQDIVTWFDQSLPPREKNRYYVFIHKVLPENSSLRIIFDSDVTITFNVRTNYLEHYIANTLNSGPQKNCGVAKNRLGKMATRRNVTKPGDWPWHAAIYRYDETASKYICGGTLISKNFILTAAHCASLRGIPLAPEVLTVYLGKFNLNRRGISNRIQKKEVKRIIIHEMFEYNHLYNDIALLKLDSEAKFTKFVQPACLWYSNALEKLPSDTIIGSVLGWGLNGNRLKEFKMPMVSETTCVYSDSFAADLIIDESKFCAGFLNGSSICKSDSGSAYQVFVPDEVQGSETSEHGAWYVRGIVSLTASKFNTPTCDPEKYVLFTNIDSYRIWIDAYIDNEDY
ncbi:chymotrypsinogen A-like isoform X2 [Vanessa cardui]|uniref:chymotrypsinogen A-like isoform X2 n=1 Tax=Vanessa cardui TaxID=171605 RepID=UPI001F13413B|nr:chymotrypsinogen A-like isoform X2 [Vanessa cardui]